MKLEYKYLYLTIIPVILGILLFSAFSSKTVGDNEEKGNEKIIKFSHSFHKDLAECTVCHSNVMTSKSSKDRLMPNHDNCKDCHDVENTDQCSTCHYDDFEPLIQHSSEIIFDHSYHLGTENMKCEQCHKGISEVDYAMNALQPYPDMATCYSCHNDRAVATNACEACHTSTANLKPVSHRSAQFIKTHKFASKQIDSNCIMCHDSNNNSCENCHVATTGITEGNTADNFYTPYAPNNSIDGAKQQKINKVHELNYRFSHGIDARSKRMDCQSCHELETFCGSCHQSKNGDFSMGGIIPTSHFKTNFANFAGSSALNEHGLLARRDIESCASCHDTQGADPVCLQCHQDFDGIRGNGIKTHTTGFMRGEKGDWHDTNSSVCFNCHSGTPGSAAGVGFCGYCHGAQ